MKHLKIFKDSIEKELQNQIKGINSTPILDRLQIHFDSLEEGDKINDLLTEQNMGSNKFLSLIYQVVSPVNIKRTTSLSLDKKEISGNTLRAKLQNLIISIGYKKINMLPNYSKYLHKTQSINSNLSIYKEIDENWSFDVSMGDVNIYDYFPLFSKELKEELNLDVDFKIQNEYKY